MAGPAERHGWILRRRARNEEMMRKPDFFIVGAPKCGTTAMDNYLSSHPDIHMAPKEPQFFGRDLELGWMRKTKSEAEYLQWIGQPADSKRIVGETSVWNLYSKTAAQEIAEYCPNARIIVMLRDPVEFLQSLHSQFLYTLQEDLEEFAAALAAEPDRKKGLRMPPNAVCREILLYREVASFTPQLQRYYQAFGRDRVRVVLLEDIRRDPAVVLAEVWRFLGVDDSHQPAFVRMNERKHWRFAALGKWMAMPPSGLRAAYRRMIPLSIRKPITMAIKGLNTKEGARRPASREVLGRLRIDLLPVIRSLGAVIGRDLSAWEG